MKPQLSKSDSQPNSIRHRLHEIIFEADTKLGLLFDVALLLAILLSVVVVCLETIDSIQIRYGKLFVIIEWILTILFTIEYVLRLYCVKRPLKYATSFFGIIDLVAILPAYIGLFLPSATSLAVVRAFRLLRIFRIFKLVGFLKDADELGRALVRARSKIIVFLGVVVISITVAGTLMYEIEKDSETVSTTEEISPDQVIEVQCQLVEAIEQKDYERAENLVGQLQPGNQKQVKSKFSSIPESMYWATVTMTTVGYGDIVPQTTLGKIVAAILILLGYSLIIVPTGFVSAEFMEAKRAETSTQSCPYCMLEGHDRDAVFCKLCGNELNENE